MRSDGSSGSFETGPFAGLVGDISGLHGRYYAQHWRFPIAFECKVASEMAAFILRYDPARDLVLSVREGDETLASISIDGSDPTLSPGQAHLRWFIVAEDLQGKGMGRKMLAQAIGFACDRGFASVYLTTFRGLDLAGALYRSAGFSLVSAAAGRTWGREVIEERLELAL